MIFDIGHSLDHRNTNPPVRLNLTAPPYNTQGLTMTLLSAKGGGKSNTLAVLAEEAHRNQLPFLVFDPNGDAGSFRELGSDVAVIGRKANQEIRSAHFDLEAATQDPLYFIRDLMLDEGFSLVVDLSGRVPAAKAAIVSDWLNAWYRLTELDEWRKPSLLLIDEAHLFAPQSRASEAQKEALTAMSLIASDGRKRGIAAVYAAQRMSLINKDVVGLSNVWLIGQTQFDGDYRRLKPYLPAAVKFDELGALQAGQYYFVGQRGYGRIQVRKRHTQDLGATPVFKPAERKERPSLKSFEFVKPTQLTMLPSDDQDGS